MSSHLPAPPWAARVTRLRVGVDPVDAVDPLRAPGRPPSGLLVLVEKVPLPHRLPARVDDAAGLPGLHRSRTGRFPLLFGSRTIDTADRIPLRIVDPERRYVPRRFSVPAPDLASVLASDDSPEKPARTFRPVLFPAARLGRAPGATTLLGRVVRPAEGPGPPPGAAWARIEAGLAGSGVVSWRAQADRDGEFVLVLGALTALVAQATTGVLRVDVTVHAAPLPSDDDPIGSPSGSRADPLHLLPVEEVAALEADDPAEAGTAVPPGHTRTSTSTVELARGRPLRPPPFVVT